MCQRALIAAALIAEPDLLVASEVSVPQSGWPLFAHQARAIAAYLEASVNPGRHIAEFHDRSPRNSKHLAIGWVEATMPH